MPIITVGRLEPEDIRLNKSGENRWIKGRVHLYGFCSKLLQNLHQKKLTFTMTTGQVLPKEPVILTGELTPYTIPNSATTIQTLKVERFFTKDDPLLEELGLSFINAYMKIVRGDKELLEKLGAAKLEVQKQLTDLLGTRNRFASTLMEHFGDDAYRELVKNPWKMIHIIPYFTIKQADAVAEKLGIPLTDERRFQEYFRYLMDQSFADHRNTYMLENEFIAFYWMNFSDDMPLDEFKQLVDRPDAPVIRSAVGYHPAHFYFAEKASYEVVKKSLSITIPTMQEEKDLVAQICSDYGMNLTEEQNHAVMSVFHTPLHIITGGPGTGKTTILQIIVEKLMHLTDVTVEEYAPFLLAAPTGKAAYRMWEQTGVTAHTIHSTFGIIPEFGCLNVEETAKRLSHIRYLIIDEASMLDTKLFGDMCRVLLAMDHIPFLLLVGDVDQLPPVQHGQVFRDLLEFLKRTSPRQVTTLTVLKRQADGSHIPELAAFIKDGGFPDEEWFQDKDDIFFVPVVMDAFQNALIERVLKPKQEMLADIQIITPYRTGATPDTIGAINKFIEPVYNPKTEKTEQCISYGDPVRTFRLGDKVINKKNRTKTVINGSIGTITNVNNMPRDIFAWTLDVTFEDGQVETYVYEELKQLELAYAITIHASQGSEYPNVVTCLLRAPNDRGFLNQNLLYVAVTRASQKLVLMGSIGIFKAAAATPQQPRRTMLAYWLRQEIRYAE